MINGVDTYKATNEFFASHFSGRINQPERHDANKAKMLSKNKRAGFKTNLSNPSFLARGLGTDKYSNYLNELRKQLAGIGLKVEFYESKDKFFPKTDNKTLFRVLSPGADVADPVVLFGTMRGENPLLIRISQRMMQNLKSCTRTLKWLLHLIKEFLLLRNSLSTSMTTNGRFHFLKSSF